MGTSGQAGTTRYVFAGTSERRDESDVKVCPRCGEMLFADMDVCYGCLYDFTKDVMGGKRSDATPRTAPRGASRGNATEVVRRATALLPRQSDPLDAIELDEVDDEPNDGLGMALDPAPPTSPSLPPRHSKRDAPSPDDTLDLSKAGMTTVFVPVSQTFAVAVSSPDVCVSVPLPSRGLTVGRDEDNDIVLRSRSVSRSHLRLLPQGDGVVVEDRGATNPATVRGMPLAGAETLAVGETVSLCDYTLELRAAESGTVG